MSQILHESLLVGLASGVFGGGLAAYLYALKEKRDRLTKAIKQATKAGFRG